MLPSISKITPDIILKILAKNVREKATEWFLRTTEVLLDADGHMLT